MAGRLVRPTLNEAQYELMDVDSKPPVAESVEAVAGDSSGAPLPADPTSLGARLRALLIWAGIATLAALSLLALAHLWTDIDLLLSVRGGSAAILDRLTPTLILGAVGLIGMLLVAWLAVLGRRGEVIAILIGFAALVGLRLFISATLDGVVSGEPQAYDDAAGAFLAGDWGFGDRPMGYIGLLAGSYALFSDRQVASEALNLLLAVLAGASVLAMGRGLYGPRVGALALLGYALWPAGALMVTVRMPQTAYDLAIVATALAATTTTSGWRGSAMVGALLGVAQWLRPSTPALIPAFLLARMWPGGPWRNLVVGAVLPMAAAFLLVMAPVIWHNSQENGSLSISTSQYGGQVLYIGTYEPSGGTFDREAIDALIAISGPERADISEVGSRIAMDRIREDPLGVGLLAVRKQDTLWGTEHFGVEYGITRRLEDRSDHPRASAAILLSQSFYFFVLLASTAGLYLMRRRPDALMVLVVLLIWSVAAVHALLEVRDRHHSYVIPVLLPLAALALARLLGRAERLIGRSDPE